MRGPRCPPPPRASDERSSLCGIRSIYFAAGTIAAAVLPDVLQDGVGIADERTVFAIVTATCALLLAGLPGRRRVPFPAAAEFR